MASRFSNPFVQYFDGNADTLPGSKLEFFQPGTVVQQDTFSDSDLTTANTNPVIADSDGRFGPIYLSDITYKVVLSTAADVVIATADPIGDLVEGQLELWLNDQSYDIPDLVTGSDDNYYRSLTDANQGNDPTTSATNWEQIEFERIFNTNVTYSIGDRSIGSDGKIYLSLTNSNLGNDPTSDTTNWGPAITSFPTQSTGDSTTLAATTAFVQTEISASASAISGLLPSTAADADHDITISTGQARNSAGAKTLTLSSTITKQIDATWVVGDNLGGLFSGTVAADTTYHLFIIEQDSDGLIDAGFDTSLTAANIPSGYTAFRRIASFITNSSSNFTAFNGVEVSGGGIRISLDNRVLDVDDATPGTSANTATLTVPIDIVVDAQLQAFVANNNLANIVITEISQTDVAATDSINTLSTTGTATERSVSEISRLTSTLGSIRYRSSDATLTDFTISTLGWTDFRR